MPYITQDQRKEIDDKLERFIGALKDIVTDDNKAGVLNYCITTILKCVYPPTPKYKHHNEIVGVLECIKQEWYRRRTAPYEDLKIQENGDV